MKLRKTKADCWRDGFFTPVFLSICAFALYGCDPGTGTSLQLAEQVSAANTDQTDPDGELGGTTSEDKATFASLTAAGFSEEQSQVIMTELGSEMLKKMKQDQNLNPERAQKLSRAVQAALQKKGLGGKSAAQIIKLVEDFSKKSDKKESRELYAAVGKSLLPDGKEASAEELKALASELAPLGGSNASDALGGLLSEAAMVSTDSQAVAEIVQSALDMRSESLTDQGLSGDEVDLELKQVLETALEQQPVTAPASLLSEAIEVALETSTTIPDSSKAGLAAVAEPKKDAGPGNGSSGNLPAVSDDVQVEAPPPPPADPSNPTDVQLSERERTSAVVSFSTDSSALDGVKYSLIQDENGAEAASCDRDPSSDSAAGTVKLSELTPGTAYLFRICAHSAEAENPLSEGVTLSFSTRQALPQDPSDIQLSSKTNDSLTLTFQSHASATGGHRVSLVAGSVAPENCSTTSASVAAGESTVSLSGLDSAATYSVRICALNTNDPQEISSGDSATATFTTDFDPDPTDPTAVTISGLDAVSANFTFTEGNNAENGSVYSLTQTADVASAQPCSDSQPTASGSLALASLQPFTDYVVRICSKSDRAENTLSTGAVLAFKTHDESPEAPSPLGATSITHNSATVSWAAYTAEPAEMRYFVGHPSSSDTSCLTGTVVNPSLGSVALTGLDPASDHKVVMCSFNRDVSTSVTPLFEIRSANFQTIDAPPQNASSLALSSSTNSSLTISFAGHPTATGGYDLSYVAGATAPADCSSVAQSIAAGETSAVIGSLAAAAQYSVRICSKNTNSPVEIADGSGATASFTTRYDPPTEASGLALSAPSAVRITASWTVGGGSTSTQRLALQAGAAPSDCNPAAGVTVVGTAELGMASSHTFYGLDPSTTYHARLCSQNPDGDESSGITASTATLASSDAQAACEEVGGQDATCTLKDGSLADGFVLTGSGTVTLPAGRTVTVNGTGRIEVAGNLVVDGALIGNFDALVAANITVSATGSISANGRGHAGGVGHQDGQGPSGGNRGKTSNAWRPSSGGGHIGKGGHSGSYDRVFGNGGHANSASTYGSGGGGSTGANGGAGGGALFMESSGTITIDGTVSAKGVNGASNSGSSSYGSGGGGAGGTVSVVASTLAGAGSLDVSGGNGGSSTGTSNTDGGGGGGGLLILDYATKSFSGTQNVAGGVGHDDAYHGGPGLVSENSNGTKTLTVNDTSGQTSNGSALDPTDFTEVSNLNLQGTANVEMLGTAGFSATGSINLSNTARLYRNGDLSISTANLVTADGTEIYANLDVNAGQATIGGIVSANGLGFAAPSSYDSAGQGPGAGFPPTALGSAWRPASGAGHIGQGGISGSYLQQSNVGAGYAPSQAKWGSSGGSSNGGSGGAGGGYIDLDVTGTFTLQTTGVIRAEGLAGGTSTSSSSYGAGGGGAGGTIEVSAATLSGDGSFSVAGGNGGTTTDVSTGGGAGGAGLVLLESSSLTYSGTVNTAGGVGQNTAGDGGSGILITDTGTVRTVTITASATDPRSPTEVHAEHLTDAHILQILGTSIVTVATGSSISTATSVSVGDTAKLYRTSSDLSITTGDLTVAAAAEIEGNLNLQVDTLTVDGTLNAAGRGFAVPGLDQAGAGPGAGAAPTVINSAYRAASGAGHTGRGGSSGTYQAAAAGGLAHTPTDSKLGSSGGSSDTALGGAGGGLITIVAQGNVDVDGLVTVAGNAGATPSNAHLGGSGGGSGGTIEISADSLSGTGTLSVAGGAGSTSTSSSSCGGGGSGGRLVITRTTTTFSGSTTLAGGAGGCANAQGGASGVLIHSDGTSQSATFDETGTGGGTSSFVPLDGLAMNTLTLSNNSTLTLTSALPSAPQTVNVEAGSTLNYDTTATLQAGSIVVGGTLRSSENMTVDATTISVSSGGAIDANVNATAETITVEGTVSATGRGFATAAYTTGAGQGPGAGQVVSMASAYNGAGGGGHVGFGGHSGSYYMGNGGSPYARSTSKHGSSGASAQGAAGGAGGGLVRLVGTTSIDISGTVESRGVNGSSSSNPALAGSGGGAGGTVEIDAPTISGTGTIDVGGGNGGASTSAVYAGGGGSAGVIELVADSLTFSGSKLTAGGAAGAAGPIAGAEGLLIETISGVETRTYHTTSTASRGDSAFLPAAGETFNHLVVSGTARLEVIGTEQLTTSQTISLSDTGLLYHDGELTVSTTALTVGTGSTFRGNLTINASTISVSGTITADGYGHAGGAAGQNGTGPGAGTGSNASAYNPASGAGHVGAGGQAGSYTGYAGGVSYLPTDSKWGSGGGASQASAGGNGGGLLILNATTSVVIEGSITAKGNNGSVSSLGSGYAGSGGGSGGTIELTTANLSGAGEITVQGGASGNSNTAAYAGGPGAGGRIVLDADSDSSTGSRTVSGGTATGNSGAAADGELVTL